MSFSNPSTDSTKAVAGPDSEEGDASGATLGSRLLKIRHWLARPIEARFIGRTVLPTIISEDCWGGEFCRRLAVPYNTPFAGAFIPATDYLSFLENIENKDAFNLERVPAAENYPIGRTPYCVIHFIHYKTWEEARDKFRRRAQRINRATLCYKIDFGKAEYTQSDIERWNRLTLSTRVALLSPQSRPGLDFSAVARSVKVPDWNIDGSAMFSIARRHFDFYHWLRTGEIRQSRWIRLLHFLLFDHVVFSGLKAKIRSIFCRPGA